MVPVFTTPTSAHIKVGSRFASSCPFTHFNPGRMINMQRRKHSQNPEPLEQKKEETCTLLFDLTFPKKLPNGPLPRLPPGQFHGISSPGPSSPCCPVCCVCIGAFTASGARGSEAASTAYSICNCVCVPIANCPAMGVIHSMLYSCLWQLCEVLCTHVDSKKGLVHGSQSYTERECVCVCVTPNLFNKLHSVR